MTYDRRPPAYRAHGPLATAPDLQELRAGRRLSVAVHEGHRHPDTTIVFVHGAGGNKAQFRNQWRHFAEAGYSLLAWDAYGHGVSPGHARAPAAFGGQAPSAAFGGPALNAAFSGPAMLADMEILLNRHRRGRTILVGHSYGARLVLATLLALQGRGQLAQIDGALLLAASPMGTITGRAMFGPVLDRLPMPVLEMARPLLAARFRRKAWHRSADPALVRVQQHAARRNTVAMMRALLTQAPVIDTAALKRLDLPAIVMAGEGDGLVPLVISEDLAASLPQSELRVVEGCGHQIMLERPEETDRAIADLLDRTA